MNLIAFPTGTTNIFPIANSATGGQLLTEFNVRSRESVPTPSSIKYMVGPSYTHSMDDYYISAQRDNTGVTINNSVIQIAPGRAVVNGHYLESLAPINIDMLEINQRLAKAGKDTLRGNLSIGLRMMYSTEKTIAGSLIAENDDNYFEGVHVVILPTDQFILPEDSPGDEYKVTAHILLATFNFQDGAVSGINNNEDKIKYIDGERIGHLDTMVDGNFLTASALDPDKLYSLSGADPDYDPTDTSTNKKLGKPTWQNSTPALMIWDKRTTPTGTGPYVPTGTGQAEFEYVSTIEAADGVDRVQLRLPHLANGRTYLYDSNNNRIHYPDRVMQLPSADFSTNTGGVVTSKYTKRIKTIDDKINNFYHVLGGQMLGLIDVLTDRSLLPPTPKYENGAVTVLTSHQTLVEIVNSLQGQVDLLQQFRNNFEEAVSQKIASSNELLEINTKLSINDQNHNSFDTSIKNLDTSINSLNSLLNDLQERIAKVEGKATGSDSEDSDGTWQDVSGDPTGTDAELLKKYKKAIEQLQGAMDSIMETSSASSSSGEDIGTDINETVQDHEDRIASLENSKVAIESSVSALTSKLETYSQEISATIDSRFTGIQATFEGRMSDYENSVESRFNNIIEEQIINKYHLNRLYVNAGDYIIVRQDMTVEASTDGRYPSTMYIAQVGNCTGIKYLGRVAKEQFSAVNREAAVKEYKRKVPFDTGRYCGLLLHEVEVSSFTPPSEVDQVFDNTSDMFSLVEAGNYGGVTENDYFAVRVVEYDEDSGQLSSMESYYFTPIGNMNTTLKWSDPIWLTGTINLATEDEVGGFLNVDSTTIGGGYVGRDDEGHLRLLDYDLLATGVLAYQLGTDFQTPVGADPDTIQSSLDDYVNYRVAFPNAEHLGSHNANSLEQRTINVTIDISDWSGEANPSIVISNIDSRFGTNVHLHLVGSASSNTSIFISDIERLKLDIASLQGAPIIYLNNCCLCYDAGVLDKLSDIKDMSLWYERYEEEDPVLSLDGMTVEIQDSLITGDISSDEEYWDDNAIGDFYYQYALKSITFDSSGNIIKAGIYITDNSTVPDDGSMTVEGSRIFGSTFKLPQSTTLPYPPSRIKKQIKISGAFVTSYPTSVLGGYVVKDNNFTIISQYVDKNNQVVPGMISVLTKYSLVKSGVIYISNTDVFSNLGPIDSWRNGSYHVFYGGTV